jgi:hypothetical protein
VRASSQLPSRNELSTDLYRFGFFTRDVKDAIIRINSLAINTFSWTLREFNRVEHMLTSPTYSDKDIAKSLDIFFERLAGDLGTLFDHIEVAIPTADQASILGGSIVNDFAIEHARLNRYVFSGRSTPSRPKQKSLM